MKPQDILDDYRTIIGLPKTVPDKVVIFRISFFAFLILLLGVSDLKANDKAFFAFGQFLNTRNQKKLIET